MRTRNRLVVYDTRSKANLNYGFTHYKCDLTTATGTQNWGPFNINSHYANECMVDELGIKSKHPVKHRRCEVTLSDIYPTPFQQPSIASPYGKIVYSGLEGQWPSTFAGHVGTLGTWDVTLATSLLPNGWSTTTISPSQETRLKEDVLEKARQLKADMLLNMVEANQVWPSLTSLASCMPNMASNWKDIRKQVKTASGAYLAWKFGVSPILQDVMHINKHLPKLGEDIKRHEQSKEQRFSVVAEFPASFSRADYTSGPNNGYVWQRIRYVGRLAKAPTVRYVLVVKPNVAYSSAFFRKLDYAMSRFATSPASLAWEKIPFSFVADWFVDIRGALDALDKTLGFAPYDIVSFTRSYNYEMSTSVFTKYFNTCNGDLMLDTYSGSVDYKHYERSLVSRGSIVPQWIPQEGKNHAGIAAALLAQMLTKLPKRYW